MMSFSRFQVTARTAWMAAVIIAGGMIFAVPCCSCASTHELQQGRVVGQMSLNGASVRGMTVGYLNGRTDLLLFEPSKSQIAVVDATNPANLRMVGRLDETEGLEPLSLSIVNNRVALLASSQQTPAASATPKSLSLVNLGTLNENEIRQQFKNVEAYAVDRSTGMLYLVTPTELKVVREPTLLSRSVRAWDEFLADR